MRLVIVLTILSSLIITVPASATIIGHSSFQRVWERTDKPVADHSTTRTWMWGPSGLSGIKSEAYAESPGGQRTVQYFDKSRMEITIPSADPNTIWYVTNGLLVVEMVTGKMQNGNNTFQQFLPAMVNVAGDADGTTGPTYSALAGVRNAPPAPDGAILTQRINRFGAITTEQSYATYGITAAHRVSVPGIDHQIATPFWEFMNSTGTVWQSGQLVNDRLFIDPFYATGYPIIEAYWSNVKVANTYKDVLIQCFERRCLTYTPGNSEGFQTEAGNVGQHYYIWRYGSLPVQPVEFGAGTFVVGQDVPAGTYRNSDSSDGCYWERLSGFSGAFEEILSNEFTSVRTIVTILPSDKGFSSSRCGVWSNDLSPIRSDPSAAFADGTYLVGSEIAPGTWKTGPQTEDCYWERVSGFTGEFDEILGNNFGDGPQIVTILPTDEGFRSQRCGTWIKQ